MAKLNGGAPVPGVLAPEMDHQATTGVAVDQASGEGTPLGAGAVGDVYVDNASSVAAFTSAGALIQRFGGGQMDAGSGVAVDGANGDVFVADSVEDRVDVFVPEEGRGSPVVDGVSARVLSAGSAELSAQIDPRGASSEYIFQYGAVDCASSPRSCTQVPVPAGQLAAGFGDRSVSAVVDGLQPNTAYYYRVLASNALGEAEGVPAVDTLHDAAFGGCAARRARVGNGLSREQARRGDRAGLESRRRQYPGLAERRSDRVARERPAAPRTGRQPKPGTDAAALHARRGWVGHGEP